MSGNHIHHSISGYIHESIQVQQGFLDDPALGAILEAVCRLCAETYRKGNKILLAGNGGSAADAQHFAAELVGRFHFDRPPLSAIALTTNTSIMTAIGNDYGYKDIFSRQILANGRAGDLFIAISTSGNSENILEAIKASRNTGMAVIGLTGRSGGTMKDLCDYCVCVPTPSTPHIQECHLIIEHIICAYVEAELFGKELH